MKTLYFTLIMLLFVACSEDVENPDLNEEEMEESSLVEGDYTGTWDDNLYTNFPISAKINKIREGLFRGPFFYSQNGSFTPCCSDAENNGHITFEVEGDSILNFNYDQSLQFYMGGCPGKYTGSGIINSNGWLLIDFGGEDCDGIHTGGKIVLRK